MYTHPFGSCKWSHHQLAFAQAQVQLNKETHHCNRSRLEKKEKARKGKKRKYYAVWLTCNDSLCDQKQPRTCWIACRNMLMRGFHLLVMLVVGDTIKDTQCGFKVDWPCFSPKTAKLWSTLVLFTAQEQWFRAVFGYTGSCHDALGQSPVLLFFLFFWSMFSPTPISAMKDCTLLFQSVIRQHDRNLSNHLYTLRFLDWSFPHWHSFKGYKMAWAELSYTCCSQQNVALFLHAWIPFQQLQTSCTLGSPHLSSPDNVAHLILGARVGNSLGSNKLDFCQGTD